MPRTAHCRIRLRANRGRHKRFGVALPRSPKLHEYGTVRAEFQPRSSHALSGWKVGVESDLFPGVQFLKLRLQLCLYAFMRIASESEPEGRFVRLDRLDDGLRGTDRIARLFSVLLAVFLATQAGGSGVIGDRLSGLMQGATGKIRSEAAR